MQPMQVDSGKTTSDDVVKIGDVNVVVKDVGKKLMVFGKSAQTNPQKQVLANDHEASSSSSARKYHQPRWCPPGLSHLQKRRLQRLRRQEQKEQEAKKLRDEHFNKYRLHAMKFQQFLQPWVMRNWWIMRLLQSAATWR